MHDNTKKRRTLRFIFWLGLFLIETSLVTGFWVVPNSNAGYDTHPALQLEIDEVMREHPGLRIAAIALLGFFILANVGLMIEIWPAFKNLQANE